MAPTSQKGGPFDFLHPGYPTPIVIDGLDAADHVWSNANQLFHYGMTFFQAMAPAKQTSKCAISGTPVSSKTLPLVLKALKVVSTQETRNSEKSAHHVSEETFNDVANSFRQLKIDDPVWKNQCHETDPVGLVLCSEMQLTFASHHQEEQKGDINLQLRQIEKQRDRNAGDSQSLANDARADKATIARHKGTIEQHSQELVTLAEKMQGIARRGREREQQLSTDLSQLRDDRTVYITTADCMTLMGT